MLLDEFQRLTQSQGVRRVGRQYYGVWQSYPYSAVVTPSGRGAVTFSFRLGGTLESGAFKQLRRQMPKCAVLLAAGGSTYRLTVNGKPFNKGDEALASILDTFVRGLRESGVTAGDLYPICHRGGCDALADLGGYSAVHYACAANRTADAAAEAQRSLQSGSYVTGFIGAFLGGLVACIPTILAYYAGWLVGYLYALIPLGAYLVMADVNRSGAQEACDRLNAAYGPFCAIVVQMDVTESGRLPQASTRLWRPTAELTFSRATPASSRRAPPTPWS